MKTPYQILDVMVDATDLEIKKAYLQGVKDNPPDRNQEQFQLIHNAYTAIKDHKSRISYELFNLPVASFDEVVDEMLSTEKDAKLTPESFIKLLHASIDDSMVQNAIPMTEK